MAYNGSISLCKDAYIASYSHEDNCKNSIIWSELKFPSPALIDEIYLALFLSSINNGVDPIIIMTELYCMR